MSVVISWIASWLRPNAVPAKKRVLNVRKKDYSDPTNTKSERRDDNVSAVMANINIRLGPEPDVVPIEHKGSALSVSNTITSLPRTDANSVEEILASSSLFDDHDFNVLEYVSPGTDLQRIHDYAVNPLFYSTPMKLGETTVLFDPFLPAVAVALAAQPKLLAKVVDVNQSFSENYKGIFRFRFWHFGDWVTVVVDDKMPKVKESLTTCKIGDGECYWLVLLEKAYAKFTSSIEPHSLASADLAFTSLTGGFVKHTPREEYNQDMYNKLVEEHGKGVLMCALTTEKCKENLNELPVNCFCTIVGFSQIVTGKGPKNLIKMSNIIHGKGTWAGCWSENCSHWKTEVEPEVAEKFKKELNSSEFYIEWGDFVKAFATLTRCYASSQLLLDCYQMKANPGVFSWIPIHNQWNPWRRTAGGAPGTVGNAFQNNPQYVVSIFPKSEKSTESLSVIYSMNVKNRDNFKTAMGMIVYKLPDEEQGRVRKFDALFFNDKSNLPIFVQEYFSYCSAFGLMYLEPGSYIFIPTAYKAEDRGEFFLRIFAQGRMGVTNMD